MNECRFERDVIAGRWTESLRAHVAQCADCEAAMLVSPHMKELASVDMREHPLPDPQVVWLKAKLLRNTFAMERAARPLKVFQAISYVVVAAAWTAVLAWKWTALQALLHSFSLERFVQNAGEAASLSMTFFGMVFILASITIVLALHTMLAED
ncbi:MAG TPA: hypothetical protein VH087_21240 [Thermoanaerobaculia bacterium]|jgi:hypothetical protein|nr:hypothetical protein [Thermoanaerobaculia bacterium]